LIHIDIGDVDETGDAAALAAARCMAHVLVGEPVSTSPGHALIRMTGSLHLAAEAGCPAWVNPKTPTALARGRG